MPKTPSILSAILVGVVLVGSGCRVGPVYQPPDLSPVTASPWRAASLGLAPQAAAVTNWWRQFGDEELVRLIDELVRQNLTLAEARQRVLAVQAVRTTVAADRLPRLDGAANVTHAATGEEAVNPQGPQPGQDMNLYSAGLAASWELDLWGRIQHLNQAADANVAAVIEDYHAAAVSLAADLAVAYLDIRTLQERLAVLDRNLDLQRQTLALATSQQEAGAGTEFAVAQAQRQLAQTQALKPPLRDALARSENRLAILLGRRPSDDLVVPGKVPQMPPILGLGLPAELLEHRADVRRAIAAYRAAVEQVGAATAAKYPTVTLSGTLNLQATTVSHLLDSQAYTYSLGPNLRVPLFDAGRLDAVVQERVAEAEQRRLAVERTLLEAIGEVENAAVGVVRSEERRQELENAVTTARRAVTLADQLYRTGLTGLGDLVDAQRYLVDLEDRSLVARRDALVETVHLYRALGGGWEILPPASPDVETNP